MLFSKRLVLVYTCIIVVPVFLAVILASEYLRVQKYQELSSIANTAAAAEARSVEENIDYFASIESMLAADDELTMLMLNATESTEESSKIKTLRNETASLERLLSLVPRLYAVRVFASNPNIPERFPILLDERRIDLAALHRWEYGYRATFMGNLDFLKQASLCTTRELTKNRRHIGYIQIAMLMDDFFPFLYGRADPDQSDFAYASGRLVSEPRIEAALAGESPKDRAALIAPILSRPEAATGQFQYRERGVDYIAAWHRVPRMDLVLVHCCSTRAVQRSTLFLRLGSAGILALSIVLLFSLVRYATGHLLSRIYSLIGGMQRVRQGDLAFSLSVEGDDEVAEALLSFNLMVERLALQIEQIKAEHKLVAETEIKAMQNQINAHFLNNALETIKMQAVLADREDIADSLTLLGKMMRYCLRWRSFWTPLEQEIEYIRAYVDLLNLRNDYRIALEVEIPEALLERNIPKMILQPIIENAFVHAIEPEGGDAVISVSADVRDERLWLCVRDFGVGIESERLRGIREYLGDDRPEREGGSSIGLKNIQQRISMFYGPGFRIEIDSEPGMGTTVRIPMPLKEGE
jgi:Predicted signal transduction protein with a C-terminal ATPase domain